MVVVKFFVLLIVVLCESKKSLVPQAILQLVQNNYGESSVAIEVLYNLERGKLLDETLQLLRGVKQLKVTPINITEVILTGPPEPKCILEPFCQQIYPDDAIFLLDTLVNYQIWQESFVEYQKMMFENFSIRETRSKLNHLVYCKYASQDDIESFIERDSYESFLLEENDRIPYIQRRCSPSGNADQSNWLRLINFPTWKENGKRKSFSDQESRIFMVAHCGLHFNSFHRNRMYHSCKQN